ncbi:MAG: hypothetical protein M5U01_29015 [Ardenticatenaceae bacterium]|nr:hypothetical protein [Ardenticatenaceae bacterium]HBY92507.1 hypothetical protein [Chloroflexota bacterium]
MRRLPRYLLVLLLLWLAVTGRPAHAESPTWFTTGPYGGWITGLDFARGRPETMLAASLGGGVWKTTDGGLHWTAVNTGLNDPDIPSVALSPAFTADNVALAGAKIGGIHRSTDGGQTWSKVYPSPGSIDADRLMEVQAVAFAPDFATSGVALAAGANHQGNRAAGIFRSADGGLSWSKRVDGNALGMSCWHVAFSPNFASDRTAFASCTAGKLYRSTDGGVTWQLRNSGLPTQDIRDIAFSPNFANDGIIFVGSYGAGVWKTTNGGLSWSRVLTSPDWWMDSRYLAIAPDFDGADGNAGDDVVFAGDINTGLWRSNDGGATWSRLEYPLLDGVSAIRKDTYVIRPMPGFDATNPAQQPLFVGTHGAGVLFHPGGGVGSGWELRVAGLAAQQAMVVHVADDGTVFAGANGGGLFRSDDGGTTWLSRNGTVYATTATTAIATAPNFASVPHLVAGNYWNAGIAYSFDRGQTWREPALGSGPRNQIRALVYSPGYPAENLIFAGTGGGSPADNGLWHSTDGGATWTHLSNQIAGKSVIALAISPTFEQDRTIFAGVYGDGLWKSNDGGGSWTQLGLAGQRVWALGISPDYANDRTIFVATEDNGLWRVTNAGSGWSSLYGGMFRGLALSPTYASDQTLYAAYAYGDVLRLTAGGNSVAPMGDTASPRPSRRGLATGRGRGPALFEAFYGMSVWQYGSAPPVCTPVPEDFNGDGTVDLQDVTAVAQRWPASSGDPAYDARFDLGGTAGVIDVVDIATVAAAWGTYCP